MAVLKARIAGNWVELGGTSGAEIDSMNYKGAWTATAFAFGDVVQRFGAYWMWQNATASTATEIPGTATSANWWLLSGIPSMTTAEIAAWSPIHTGNPVFNTDKQTMFVRVSSTWQPVQPQAYTGFAYRSSTQSPGASVWTTAVSTTAPNMPAGDYLCTGALWGASAVAVGGSCRISTDGGDAPNWSAFHSPADSTTRLISVAQWVYNKASPGTVTINLAVNPTIGGLTVSIGTSITWHYVGAT